MSQGINERQRQRFIMLGERMAADCKAAFEAELLAPSLFDDATIEVVRAWATGWCRGLGIGPEVLEAKLARELSSILQQEQWRCKRL